MNPQIKQKWVYALRSGEYKQTQRRLRDEDGFCCLGVLCDLYGKENQLEWESSRHNGNVYMFQDMVASLPLSVVEWADLEDYNPHVNVGKSTLTGLNDAGSTFIEIANLIEEQL